ncbi:MAG: DJ-1/PfpI family protein [Steroidobacteraceae bacterium]
MTPKRLAILAALVGIPLLSACGPGAQAAHLPMSQPVIRVGVVMFNGVEPIDYAGPYETFAQAGFSVVTVSADGKPVTGMGLKVAPDYSFANAPQFDVLVVPGGDVGGAAHDKALLDFIRQRSVSARQVLSVCTGTYILAAAGLLDGLKATTFVEAAQNLAATYPKVHVLSNVRWVDNGKIVTSAGLTTGIDAALHVLGKLEGLNSARTVAMRMEYAWQPQAQAGFVRGDMADRYFPDLSHVSWPKDAHFEPILSLGDTTRWQSLTRVETKLPPRALLARIDSAVGQIPGWQAQPSQGPHHWRDATGGKQVEVSYSSRAAPNDGYVVAANVRVEGQQRDGAASSESK